MTDTDPEIENLIRRLADAALNIAERQKALRVLQSESMRGAMFSPYMPDYMSALRAASEAPDMVFRQRVIGVLCRERDSLTQQRLIDGLDDPSQALVPPEKALQFLAYDIHAGVFPVARKIADTPPSDAAQHEALKILGADPASSEVLAKIMVDPAEDFEARRLATIGLKCANAERFREAAKEVLAQPRDAEAVRALVLVGLKSSHESCMDRDLRAIAKKMLDEPAMGDDLKAQVNGFLASGWDKPADEEGAQDPAKASDGSAVA